MIHFGILKTIGAWVSHEVTLRYLIDYNCSDKNLADVPELIPWSSQFFHQILQKVHPIIVLFRLKQNDLCTKVYLITVQYRENEYEETKNSVGVLAMNFIPRRKRKISSVSNKIEIRHGTNKYNVFSIQRHLEEQTNCTLVHLSNSKSKIHQQL